MQFSIFLYLQLKEAYKSRTCFVDHTRRYMQLLLQSPKRSDHYIFSQSLKCLQGNCKKKYLLSASTFCKCKVFHVPFQEQP